MADFENIEKFNTGVQHLSKSAKEKLAAMMNSLNIGQRGTLLKSLRVKYGKQSEMIERISFSFARHGIFVNLGVGRGYPINSISGNAAVINTVTGKKRMPKPWIKEPVDKFVQTLADYIAEQHGDMAIDSINVTGVKK